VARRRTLTALMLPQFMVVVNLAMVNVAIPAIRDTFSAPADLVAWVVTIYTLPYVAFMPLYGRLGDDLGIPRMLAVACAVFLAGTGINTVATGLPLLLLGRFVQGAGASGVVPLAIAMIWRAFPSETRGDALGQWNAVGPIGAVSGGLAGGLIIEGLGWRSVFFLPVIAAIVALSQVRKLGDTTPRSHGLGRFDWAGVALLSLSLAALLLYVSSSTVTGRPALTDWRLLLVTLALLSAFVWRERTAPAPFVDLGILRDDSLVKASLCGAMRMFVMSCTVFLTPLFLADVKHQSAAAIGVISTVHSAGLFPTMYFGGRIADRWGSRRPIVIGMGAQVISILLLIATAGSAGATWVIVARLLQGLGAGLALPAMHRAAMAGSDDDTGGAAAGLYSMIRFCGMLLGTADAGVLLQALLDNGSGVLVSYQVTYSVTAAVALLSVITALTLRQDSATS